MEPPPENGEKLTEAPNLRPLTTLKWPYIPEEPSYNDPLKQYDPKPLKLKDYENIGKSNLIFRFFVLNYYPSHIA